MKTLANQSIAAAFNQSFSLITPFSIIGLALWISGASSSASDFRDYASLIISDHFRFFQQPNTPVSVPRSRATLAQPCFTPLASYIQRHLLTAKKFIISLSIGVIIIDRLGPGIDTKNGLSFLFGQNIKGRYP
jgi:hypothetical protein